jgi:TolA-binding protein
MLSPDTSLGPYRLVAKIGAGGMGEVWKAEDTRLGRMVAIKILPAAVAADADALARLKREARTAAQLYHPNIATIHSIEEDGDRLFIVMELVDGEPLSQLMRRGAMSEADLCRIARGVADALAEAHAKGIIHRDIKPDNVIVSGSRVKVLDFGIAKQVGVETQHGTEGTTAFMTQRGLIVGTVHYMSPEQALGKSLDPRTDIFSLGVVMYQAATGRLPFRGETVTETITQIVRDEPQEARALNAAISPGLNAIIRRCMEKKREDRFANAAELVAALDGQLGSAPTVPYTSANAAGTPTVITGVRPKRRRWIPILAALVVIAALGSWLTVRRPAPVVAPAPKPVAAPSSTNVNVIATPPTTTTQSTVVAGASPARAAVAAAPTQSTPPVPAPAPAPVEPPRLNSLDQRYEIAVQQLRAGDLLLARDAFLDIERADAHYARAHFRLGELLLASHNMVAARTQFERALEDPDRLDARERQLSQLGLAISLGQRVIAHERAREFVRTWPDDPDFHALQRALKEDDGVARPPLRGGRRGWRH